MKMTYEERLAELIKKLRRQYHGWNGQITGARYFLDAAEMLQTAADENARLREAQRWIPIGERLPNSDALVLVFSEPMRGSEAQIQRAKGWACHNPRTDITHWMPLPAPPEEG